MSAHRNTMSLFQGLRGGLIALTVAMVGDAIHLSTAHQYVVIIALVGVFVCGDAIAEIRSKQ